VSYGELRARVADTLSSSTDGAAYARVLEWRMRVFTIAQLTDFLVLVYAPYTSLKVVYAVGFSLYRARTAWTIIHERVHRAELPNTFAKIFFDICTVFVARFWKAHHLQHHAHTNTERDPDTRMFFFRDLNDARKEPAGVFRRAFRFVTTLAQYPFFFALFLFRSLSTYKGGNALLYLASIFVYSGFASFVLPKAAATLNAQMNFGLGALYILLTFAPTHTASKTNFDTNGGDALLDQLAATNDVWPHSRLWSFLCGGINLHIEHHLFPLVPFHELPRIVPVVEAFARERGLPYNAYSLPGI